MLGKLYPYHGRRKERDAVSTQPQNTPTIRFCSCMDGMTRISYERMNAMGKRMLVVIDMQNDFIDGSLGSPEAASIVGKVCDKIDGWDGYTCFTFDTHYEDYLDTIEGKYIPVEHCINETHGWQLNNEVEKRRTEGSFPVYKNAFGALDLPGIIQYLEVRDVELIGLCTDICVISNALLLRSALPDINISVDASCCAGTSPESHRAALEVMRRCCIDIIND